VCLLVLLKKEANMLVRNVDKQQPTYGVQC